jgi:hypothetical protein
MTRAVLEEEQTMKEHPGPADRMQIGLADIYPQAWLDRQLRLAERLALRIPRGTRAASQNAISAMRRFPS